MERPGRIPVLIESIARRALVSGLLIAWASSLAPEAAATVFMSQREALEQSFPGARCERRAFVLTPQQVKAVQARAGAKLSSRLATAYLAWRGDTLAGVAFFDTRNVRTMPCVMMTSIGPDATVQRVDLLAFHEPPDYRPPARWLGLFERRRLDERLWPRRDIRNLSGATLSTRAITEGVRQALALFEVLVKPTLGAETSTAPKASAEGRR